MCIFGVFSQCSYRFEVTYVVHVLRKMFSIINVIIVVCVSTNIDAVDYLPCTENVDGVAMNLARRILENHLPQGYVLRDYYPVTQTGRNPHRWIAEYRRVDNIYRQDCDYLVDVRSTFKQHCPPGCEISQMLVSDSPNRQFIQIQILVNCRCQKLPRRRRGLFAAVSLWNCTSLSYSVYNFFYGTVFTIVVCFQPC